MTDREFISILADLRDAIDTTEVAFAPPEKLGARLALQYVLGRYIMKEGVLLGSKEHEKLIRMVFGKGRR